jgi:hypothetical protein
VSRQKTAVVGGEEEETFHASKGGGEEGETF